MENGHRKDKVYYDTIDTEPGALQDNEMFVIRVQKIDANTKERVLTDLQVRLSLIGDEIKVFCVQSHL